LIAVDETGPSVAEDTMKFYEAVKGSLRTKRSKEIESPVYG